jgi:hypothetical protein
VVPEADQDHAGDADGSEQLGQPIDVELVAGGGEGVEGCLDLAVEVQPGHGSYVRIMEVRGVGELGGRGGAVPVRPG